MKKNLIFIIFICICLMLDAAKPIEITLDSLTYELNLDTKEFCVAKANKDIHIAHICDSVEYEGTKYPVTSIEQAFCDCIKLDSVAIPETILEIGKYAFGGCTKLTSISLPTSIHVIRENTFSQAGLKSINIPESINIIEKEAFYRCSKLEEVVFNGSVKEIQEGAFCTYGFGISEDKGNIKNVYIPSLEDWNNIKFGTSNANPLSRNNSSLYIDNKLIEDLIIPDGIVTLSVRAFEGCGSIKSIITSDFLESISNSAFYDCPNLLSVELGRGIREIESRAFSNCPNLETVIVYAMTPPVLNISMNWWSGEPENAFYNSYPEYMTLHIPEGTKEAYEKADGWKDFGIIIEDLPNDTGVDNVSIDEYLPMSIYNMNGICVYSGFDDYSLPSGFYIVKQGSKCRKIKI